MMPIQITIREIKNSAALEELIHKRAEKLKQYYGRIINCKVTVELSQKNKHQGKLYNVRIDVSVPGKNLLATHQFNQQVHVAVRESFNVIERQLEEHESKRKGNIKSHMGLIRGRVTRLLWREGYGFIAGQDGNEYYFSMTNMSHPHFEQLSIGDIVEYAGIIEDDGRHAHHVMKCKHETLSPFS